MSWVVSSVEPHIVLNIRQYKIIADVWEYLNGFIIRTLSQDGSNWNLKLLNILKEINPFKIITLDC